MEIKKTLSVYFFKWIVKIVFVGLVMIVLNVNIVTVGINNDFFLPANEPMKQSEKIKGIIENSEKIDPDIIPSELDYAIFSKKTNEIIKSNLSPRNIEEAKKKVRHTDNRKSSSYLRYDSKDEILLVHYTLKIQFANLKLRKAVPNPGVILSVFSIILYCIYFIFNIRKFSRVIIQENQKLISVTEKIKERDLNFEFPEVKFAEYKDVMGAMQSLSEALVKSIQSEIESKRSKAEQISYLIHDIKIPLTIVKGNIELLEVSMNDELEENFCDIMGAIKQIELYIQEVIDINLNNREIMLSKEAVPVIEFVGLIEDEVKHLVNNNVIIENKTVKGTKLFLDVHLVIRAINNILMNGIERTPANEVVKFIIEQEKEKIKFIIIDGGPGFSEEALQKGTELFYTENYGRTNNSHYGLGLTFAEKVIKQHNGKIKLSNNKNHSGEVLIELPVLNKEF
ncbi:sensor histidine kinase [Bacillus paranthracis]|uniref:histidine kinase n=1 Tax=Bacillus paranthracis TaxID=2026186 RepID=A0AAJ1K6Z4_9BACI|nr:sensor histidine kinase [Bacillus paranthracis]MDG0949141.1 sensor histidine kinase [Bacillus paranthracis]MDG0954758.1 sensor histidine kinase [Bacillus paranthracis]